MERPRITLRGMMALVAVAALTFGAERMWRRRQHYLALAAPHAQQETFHADLARDLAGEPLDVPSQMATALLPDGSVVEFQGAARKPHYPPSDPRPADEATVRRLVEMCRKEAEHEGRIRREYERRASRPWRFGAPAEPIPPKPGPLPNF